MTDFAKIDTTIYIGNLPIHQPVTAFTDYIIAILCFYFYRNLNRLSTDDISIKHWKHFFLLLSIASFTGGCSHGFFAIHEGFAYKSFWLAMQSFNVLSVFYAQQATLCSALQYSTKKNYWNLSYKIQLVLFLIAVFVFHNFLVVVIDSTIGLIPIMIIHFMDAKKIKSSVWIAYGIMVLFLAAIVNTTKFSFHVYFNYLDIAHIFIMINLSLIFKGVREKITS